MLTSIDPVETRRYAGLTKYSEFPEYLLKKACDTALILAKACASWHTYQYNASRNLILSPAPIALTGHSITQHLQEALHVTLLTVTIGQSLEEEITNSFRQGNYTAALLLDAAGTTAVESAANHVNRMIEQQAALSGYCTNYRFSPGYGDWNIAVQPTLLAQAGGADIDVTVTDSCMLIPRKSITAIIGWLPHKVAGTPVECGRSCRQCTLTSCPIRKES